MQKRFHPMQRQIQTKIVQANWIRYPVNGNRSSFMPQSSTVQHGNMGPKTAASVPRSKSEKEKKIGHRRVGVGGEITYKKVVNQEIINWRQKTTL